MTAGIWPPRSSSIKAMLSSAAMEAGMAGGGGGMTIGCEGKLTGGWLSFQRLPTMATRLILSWTTESYTVNNSEM